MMPAPLSLDGSANGQANPLTQFWRKFDASVSWHFLIFSLIMGLSRYTSRPQCLGANNTSTLIEHKQNEEKSENVGNHLNLRPCLGFDIIPMGDLSFLF